MKLEPSGPAWTPSADTVSTDEPRVLGKGSHALPRMQCQKENENQKFTSPLGLLIIKVPAGHAPVLKHGHSYTMAAGHRLQYIE